MNNNNSLNAISKYHGHYSKKNRGEWKKILSEYVNNNNRPTVARFCIKHNVSHVMFYEWRKKLYPDFSVKKNSLAKSIENINQHSKSESRFIEIKSFDKIDKANDSNEAYSPTSALPKANLPKISSSFSISLPSAITVKFDNGCQLSELTKLISVLNVS